MHVKCVLIDVFLYLQITMDWLPDFNIIMDPVVSLKRPLSVDYSLCIFCYQAEFWVFDYLISIKQNGRQIPFV